MPTSMRKQLLGLAIVIGFALAVAACGGDGGGGAEEAGAAGGGVEGPPDGPASAGEITDAPPAGEIRAEIEGQTYTGALANCQITGSVFLIGGQVDVDGASYDIGGNGSSTGTRWVGQAGLTPRSNGPSWNSSGGAVTVDGSTVLYIGQFTKNDAGSSSEVGEGRLIATCP